LSPALQEKSQHLIAIRTDLQTRRERLWQFIRTVDFLYAVLPAVFAAGFLGLLVFAGQRRQNVLALVGVSIALLLIVLILIKYSRGRLVDEVRNPPYIPAATHIYDSLVAGLRQALLYGLAFWIAVWVLCWAGGSSRAAVAFRKFLRLPELAKSRPGGWWQNLRAFAARQRAWLWLGIAGLVLLYLAFAATVSAAVVTNTVLVAVCGGLTIQLLAPHKAL